MSRILVVEDEVVIRSSIVRLLTRHSYLVDEAGSVEEAFALNLQDFDLIISDLRLPDQHGTTIIEKANTVPVLIMTSFASVKSAVDSMRMGAVDYITKPFDHDEMIITVARILKTVTLEKQNKALKADLDKTFPTTNMLGNCAAMQVMFKHIQKAAPTNSTVLIWGESGTGKELVARALHDQSLRSTGPMISVNCAAIPETLVESELFGYEKGAFTGANQHRKGLVEAADGGTLFLDEIGELPLEAQARLLRLLQEKEIRRIGSTESRRVDIRLVAATHRDLKACSQAGTFREDLYYRLHVLQLDLPPLRDREEDVLMIATTFLDRIGREMNRANLSFSKDTVKAINAYHWPGNIRELENAIERAAILSDEDVISAEDLSIPSVQSTAKPTSRRVNPPLLAASQTGTPDIGVTDNGEDNDPRSGLSLEDYFQSFIIEHQDNMTETELAQKLGVSRKCLWERRQKLGIPRKK